MALLLGLVCLALLVASFAPGHIQLEAHELVVPQSRGLSWRWWLSTGLVLLLQLTVQLLDHVLQLLEFLGVGVGGGGDGAGATASSGGLLPKDLLGRLQDDTSFLLGPFSCCGTWVCLADLGPPDFSLDEHSRLEGGQ